MLNRRKQLQADDERASLVENPFHNSDNSVPNQFSQIDFLASNQYVNNQSSAQLSNATNSLLPTPNQRKTREGQIEEQQSHLISRYQFQNSITRRHESPSYSAVPSLSYSGESYELLTSGTSNSRAIDLGSTDSYKHQTDFIYYTVQPGDTLQNLSVKYSCPVASIKRLNNLWSDQEFYGLSKLKLPAGKLRLIADVIDEERTRSSISEEQDPSKHPISSLGHLTQFPTTTNSVQWNQPDYVHNYDCNVDSQIHREDFKNSSVSDSIFKNLDLNIEKARTAARSYDDNASAIFQSLVESGNIVVEDDPNTIARREAETLLNDMSDYGLSYSGLILFIFIVCLICPLAYVIYLEETHHDSNKAP